MNCDASYYLCKNLVYLDQTEYKGYFCSFICKKCRCQENSTECVDFEQENEE